MRRYCILLLLCLIVPFMGCDDNNYNRIPNVYTYLKLNIYTTGKDLVAIPSYKRFTSVEETFDADTHLGYGGLLVVNGVDGVMRAYDLACPVEANPTVRIVVDSTLLYARCPKCNSLYNVSDFDAMGMPMEGVARENRYFLKRYTVTPIQYTGDFYITN